MPAQIHIGYDEGKYKELTDSLEGAEIPLALMRALNKAGAKVRTKIVKAVAEDLPFTQKTIKEQIGIKRASRAHLETVITVSQKGIPLIDFKPRALKSGKGGG